MNVTDFAQAARLILRLALHGVGASRRRIGAAKRLAALAVRGAPLEAAVTIHWDAHHIPFIEARSDNDLAVALGVVHAHLRLGQIEILRRVALARVAQAVGPLGLGIDQMVKRFDIARAVPGILATMPDETRSWLDGFARGLNHVIAQAPELPPEFRLLGLTREPWSIADLVTVGRLVSADVNWLVWMRLLRHRGDPGWPALWHRLLSADTLSVLSGESDSSGVQSGPGASLRSGSNSVVLAPAKSETGGAMIANDPHLSIVLPNPFLLAGFISPSYHAVGCMIPGVPFLAFGRNPHLAWGGASLHAASSDLVALPEGAPLRERRETIAVRGRADADMTIAESEWGPVIAPGLALRWIGHTPSDEFTAMLRLMRARDGTQFRAALASYAVPGLEMNFATADGHIGRMTAAKLPQRDAGLPADMAQAPQPGWDAILTAGDLPARCDPEEGFLASANARPDFASPVIGFHFSPPDRKARFVEILSGETRFSVRDLMRLQCDVHHARALAMGRSLLAWLGETGSPGRRKPLITALEDWDGNYDAASHGALAFELLLFHLARALVPARLRETYASGWSLRGLVWADIAAAAPATRAVALAHAVAAAAKDFGRGKPWGALHRLRLGTMLGAAPGLGRLYRIADLPAAGSSETILKTAHAPSRRRHGTAYGSVARHISDMSDPDANFFALLGGQDGWPGSETAGDQVTLWTRGDYVTLPLTPERARAAAAYTMTLTP